MTRPKSGGMLLVHRDSSKNSFHCFIVITGHLLLTSLIFTSAAWAATTTGHQHVVSQGLSGPHQPQPLMLSSKPPAIVSNIGLAPTTATFVIPPQTSSTPKPTIDISSSSSSGSNSNFHSISSQHSPAATLMPTPSNTSRPPVALTSPSPPVTPPPSASASTLGSTPPPSTISMIVSRPGTTVAPVNPVPSSDRAELTVSPSASLTTPSSEEPFMFTTFPPEPNSFRTNRSHEELTFSHGNMDPSFQQHPAPRPEFAAPSITGQEVPSFENPHVANDNSNNNNNNNNMPSLMESSQDPRSHSVNNNSLAQAPPNTDDPQSQANSSISPVPIINPETVSNSPQVPPPSTHHANNATLDSITSQNYPSSTTISNGTGAESREMTGRIEEPAGSSQFQPEGRSQDQAPFGRSNSNQSGPPVNSTISLEKKHQILKPKSKFKCTQSSDCHNGGLCHAGKCYCESGFTGDSCDTNIDECLQAGPEPCQNNGKCIDEINGYKCECPPGFRGDFCQELADMCADSPCRNSATCINQHTNYTCNCKPGWDGRHCEINIDDCAKNPCQNGATCLDLIDNYKCECAAGFTGTNCEVNVDDCLGSPCQNNATCHDLTNDYECECLPGFTGKNCQVNIDECASNPCGLNGDCTDLVDGYNCTCHDGWRGDHCDLDVNECENRNVCANNATCVNTNGGFQCKCRDGYSGKKCADISDYCKAKQPCNFNGNCKNTRSNPPFRCECFTGYLGSQCDRKRTCKPGDCSFEHAHCVSNTTCACLPGRREERTMCEYVTSCEQVEGDLCLHGGTCRNLDSGGYHCTCQDPWYGPVCQFRAETQFDAILLVIITCVGFLLTACAVVSLVIFRSVRKARATRGTYSPSTQEKFGNSASDLLKPPNPERLI